MKKTTIAQVLFLACLTTGAMAAPSHPTCPATIMINNGQMNPDQQWIVTQYELNAAGQKAPAYEMLFLGASYGYNQPHQHNTQQISCDYTSSDGESNVEMTTKQTGYAYPPLSSKYSGSKWEASTKDTAECGFTMGYASNDECPWS